MSTKNQNQEPSPSKLEQLEHREGELWRLSLILLGLLAAGLAVISWSALRELPQRLEALPIGAVVLVVLFAVYAWTKKREIAELRGFVRGLQVQAGNPPTDQQLQQLVDVISKSQRGYRDLIDSLDHVVFVLSLKGEIQVLNRRFAEIAGRSFAEAVGRPLDEILAEPTRAVAEKALPSFLEKTAWSGVVRVRLRRNGEVRYFDCVLRAVTRDDRVLGVSGLARDVTQQREAEMRFTQLFETLQEGVYFSTPDGTILDVNPTLVRMLGYQDKEELLRRNAYELYADPAQRRALVQELEQKGSVRDREIVLCRKDGRLIFCRDTATAVRDDSGRVLRYQGTLVDTTHRREMEKRLHDEQEFVRRLVDGFPDLIVVLDAAGRYTYVSGRIRELLGYGPEELLGETLGNRTHPDDRATLLALHRDLVTGKRRYGDVEYHTQHKDGSWRTFRANASPLFDAEGRITGVIASARDVTEVMRLEQQLIQSEKLAAMGQMIAGVAHELNKPLAAILGSTDLLLEQAPDEPARRQAEIAHQEARRAAQIVEGLLSFSRPSALRWTRVNLDELVQRALQLHEPALRAANISVDFLQEPRLPPVAGDANRLVQLFLNLITNAEQAIHSVRESGTLRMRFGQSDRNVWVTIQDDGPGISPQILPRIFDPFFTTKRPGRGTGLGLSICLAIAKEHSGNIEAQTVPQGGALFKVTLPAADDAQLYQSESVGEQAPATR